jgi:hypothetical protein
LLYWYKSTNTDTCGAACQVSVGVAVLGCVWRGRPGAPRHYYVSSYYSYICVSSYVACDSEGGAGGVTGGGGGPQREKVHREAADAR